MIKVLEQLEVPFYLLVIAMCMFERGSTMLALTLVLISFFRLWVERIKSNDE